MRRQLALTLLLGMSLFGAFEAQASSPVQNGSSSSNATPATSVANDPSHVANMVLAAASTTRLDPNTLSGEPDAVNPGKDGWEVMVVPYLWASGMKADISTPQGEGIDIDQSFTDILSDIKFTFMGALQARRGRFVTVHDIIFLNMESTEDGNIGPGLVEAEADMRVLTTTHLAGYRVVDKGPLFVDLMAGARMTSIKADLDLSGPFQTIERGSSKTKVGPVIASRFRVPFGERWGLELYGDLGGFGVTSDLSWQLLGTVQYEISDHWRLGAGWRHFSAEQEKDGFKIDLAMTGPFLAFGYRF